MKKNIFLALLSGLLLAAAWPTHGFALFAFIGFIPLIWAEYRIRTSKIVRSNAKVFVVAYLAFVTWNTLTTWWLWFSTPFGMLFAILVNSLVMAIVFLIYHIVAKRLPSKIHWVFLPAIWIAFEKFHLNWDFSWPWLNLGNVFSETTTWIQWYEYTGSFGGSLWVWIINIGLYKTFIHYYENRDRNRLKIGLSKNLLGIAIPIIISAIIAHNYMEKGESLSVVIVQPNINPYTEKYERSNNDIAILLGNLADVKMDSSVDFVIAPETVFAKNLRLDEFERSQAIYILKQFIAVYPNTNFLGGVAMIDFITDINTLNPQSNFLKDGLWYDDYNSAFLLNKKEEIALYHKSKLVVGVENFPYQSILRPLLGNIMIDLGGTVAMKTTQKDREVFVGNNPNQKAAPIICYESVYGEYVTDYVKNGANFLAIITNDAWWDNTQGHKQHLSYAKLRAIETRRSIARSANTGISAIINQKGELVQTLGYEKQGSIKGNLKLNNELTFYTSYGDYIARIALLVAGLIFFYSIGRKKNRL